MNLKVNDRVRAKVVITEGGDEFIPDPDAVFPDGHFIHAEVGELGTVVHVYGPPLRTLSNGLLPFGISVCFDRKHTVVGVVAPDEVEYVDA